MIWPEPPTCHDDPTSTRWQVNPARWRDADRERTRKCECGYDSIGPYGESFRTCSFCLSIHPEDLAREMQTNNVKLGGSDWKYGFPHKFYVEGIPNTLAGRDVDSTSSGRGVDHEPTPDEIGVPPDMHGTVYSCWFPNSQRPGWWIVHHHMRTPAPATAHAKFYTAHLEDDGYDEEAHDLILRLVSAASGIQFSRQVDDQTGKSKVVYRANYFGYQKS